MSEPMHTEAEWRAIVTALIHEADALRVGLDEANRLIDATVPELKEVVEAASATGDTIKALRHELTQLLVEVRLAAQLLARGRNRDHARALQRRCERVEDIMKGGDR